MMTYPWQQKQFDLLHNALLQNRLSHAYLLSGMCGLGKTDFARAFASILLCESVQESVTACGTCRGCKQFLANTHPDFIEIIPHEKNHSIKIDQIRELSQKISQTSHAGGYQVVIISPADAMPVQAANALLKTLEEPNGHVIIFLIDNQKHILPATIASRCQKIHFYHDDANLILKNQDGALRESVLNHLQQVILRNSNPIVPIAQWVKHDLMLLLDMLLLFFIDISRIQKNASENYLINRTHYPALKKLAEKMSPLETQNTIAMICEKKNYLSRGINLNAQLCLENIFISLLASYGGDAHGGLHRNP